MLRNHVSLALNLLWTQLVSFTALRSHYLQCHCFYIKIFHQFATKGIAIFCAAGWSLPYGVRPSSGRRSYNVAKLSRACGEGQRFALPQKDAYLDCVGGVLVWRRCSTGFFFDAGTKSCNPANSRSPGT